MKYDLAAITTDVLYEISRKDFFPGAGIGVAGAVWLDGIKQEDRTGIITALRECGENYRRRVVVVQPRVTATELARVKKNKDRKKDTARVARMKQLDTLLVAAEADCRALSADLVVIGQRI